jgi:hypothetical protein
LEEAALLSKVAAKPSDWRLGSDPCFIKLAYWPENESLQASRELANGMYLPVSYIRMLLKNSPGRGALGYDNVERHLVGQQFIELVTHGLVGTVGVTVEELRKLVDKQVAAGRSVMVGTERSSETVHEREQRLRSRSAVDRSYQHEVTTSQQHEVANPKQPPTATPNERLTLF